LKKFKTEPYNKYWQNLIPWLGLYLMMMMIDGGDPDDDDDYWW
jgi:hypothetical protein